MAVICILVVVAAFLIFKPKGPLPAPILPQPSPTPEPVSLNSDPALFQARDYAAALEPQEEILRTRCDYIVTGPGTVIVFVTAEEMAILKRGFRPELVHENEEIIFTAPTSEGN